MHLSENTQQIDHCDETKKEYSWLIPHWTPELKETTSWTTANQAKDIASSPTHLWKFYVEAVIESEAQTTEVYWMKHLKRDPLETVSD